MVLTNSEIRMAGRFLNLRHEIRLFAFPRLSGERQWFPWVLAPRSIEVQDVGVLQNVRAYFLTISLQYKRMIILKLTAPDSVQRC